MKSYTINTLKLCRHSGIANHSITHSITLIKKEFKACEQSFSFFHQITVLKFGLSTFKNVCVIYFIEGHFKMVKNAFYFISKALFVLNIFKFFFMFKSLQNLKIFDVTTWLTNNCNKHVAQYLTKQSQPDNESRSFNRI